MKYSLKEEIARSHQTVDNDPIQYDEHEDVDVEMYANDAGQWSVKVSCVADPSLSFPMQKFPDEYSAQHYARQCADRIIRKRMNEGTLMKKKYSLVEQMYSDDPLLNESILAWIAGLIGMLLKQWSEESTTTTTETVQEIEAAAKDSLAEISKNELGEEVKSFDDLDLSDPNQRKVVYKTQAKYDYEGAYQKFAKNFQQVMDVDPDWFPPEDEDKKKVWSSKQGKVIQQSIYAYGGFCIAELEWWKKFGFKVEKDHTAAVEAVKNNSPEFGSVFKWAQFIKETLNEQCRFYWDYAKGNLKIKEAEMPLKLHNGILGQIDKILPLLEEASKKKADDVPEYVKNRPDEEQLASMIQSLKDNTNEKNVTELARYYVNLGVKLSEERNGKLATEKQVKDMQAFFEQEGWEEKFKSDSNLISNFGTDTYGKEELTIRKAFIDKYKELSENVTEESVRRLVRQLILEGLSDDLATVTSGRDAKKKFAQYVDQNEFKKGTIVHWVGSTRALKKIIESPQNKDEISCNFYPNGGHRDWMARGPKKPIGVIVEGYVTYAGKENMFTGFAKRPRKKADRAKYDHRKASSGINKYPYEMWKDEEDYLEHLRNPNVPQTKAEDMEPYGIKRDLGDDAWMGMMGSSKKPHQDWNEVLVDNWKIVGIAYGGVGRYGLSERMVRSIKQIAKDNGLRAYKMGKMT